MDEQTSSRFSRVLAAKEEFVAGMLGGNEDVGHMRQMLDHEIWSRYDGDMMNLDVESMWITWVPVDM